MSVRRLLTTFALASGALYGWGDKGHQIANGLALNTLPPATRAWFLGQEERMRALGPEADRRKAHDNKEARRHFLDCEIYGGAATVPFEDEAAIAQVGRAAWIKNGQLPWIIQLRYRDLVAAFRSGDRNAVVLAAGELGHYVADAQVPLHTTNNFDGQLTDQKGVHARWESGLVERFVIEEELRPAHASVLRDPARAPWDWIQQSYALAPKVLADDRDADSTSPQRDKAKRRTGAYWSLYWESEGSIVKMQLTRSAERLGDLILTAWVEAGKPVTPAR